MNRAPVLARIASFQSSAAVVSMALGVAACGAGTDFGRGSRGGHGGGLDPNDGGAEAVEGGGSAGTGTGTGTGGTADSSSPMLDAGSTEAMAHVGEEIAMVSGNGQVLLSGWPNIDPLVVAVTKGGVPVVGETVSWTAATDVNIASGVTTTVTDSNGQAQVQVIGGGIMAGLSYIQGQVQATISTGSVDFWTTTTWEGPSDEQFTADAQLLQPSAGVTLGSGKAGSVLTAAVQVLVYATTGDHSGGGIQYAGVRLTDAEDSTMPPGGGVTCVGGTVLTDSTGTATCDVQLGTTPGTYGLSVAIGGFRLFPGRTVTITP